MESFILFSAAFPDCQAEERLSGATDKQKLASLVLRANELIAEKQFDYAPIDKAKVAVLAQKKVSKPSDLLQFFSSFQASRLDAPLEAAITTPPREVTEEERKKYDAQRKAFREIALSYYVKTVFDQALPFDAPKFSGKPSKKEVRLASNNPDWQVVKKASLEVERKETFMGLVGIQTALRRKLGSLLGIDGYADKFLSKFPQRKSVARLAEILAAVNEAELDAEIRRCAAGENFKAARRFFFSRVFEHAGFPPFVGTETASDAYPELKIPKPRGNFGGKKK